MAAAGFGTAMFRPTAIASLFKANVDDAGRPTVWNFGRYRNPKVDQLLAQANVTSDPAKQATIMAEVQKIVWDDAPYVWLHVNENATAVRKYSTRVGGGITRERRPSRYTSAT